MRTHKTRTIVWLLIASGALLAAASFAADPPKKSATAALETQIATGMKERGLGAVGPPFKSMEGQWKATQKTWLEAGQPTVTEGTCETKLVSRGRFLERRYKSSLAGQFYEGYGLMGRDERKGTYTLLWGDNRGSGIESYEGTMDTTAHELTMRGVGKAPNGASTELRVVTYWPDANRHVFSMYGPRDGKEELMMEITYQRSGR